MAKGRLVLKGETALHLLRHVSIHTLRDIVLDLEGATFGDEYIYAHRLASQILADRERVILESTDTLVTDPEFDD